MEGPATSNTPVPAGLTPAQTGQLSISTQPNQGGTICVVYKNSASIADGACPVTSSTPSSTPSSPFPGSPLSSPSLNSGNPDQETSPNPGKQGVSGGAAAGIAIGCLLSGAIIALIVCFILYRRKSRQSGARYPSHLPYDSKYKQGAVPVINSTPKGINQNIDNLLPQPVEDDAITKELSKIRDNIKNHVRAYYHFQPVHGEIDRSRMAEFAAGTGLSASALSNMLSNSSTRGDTIRLFIAWSILSRSETTKPTLLPGGLGSLMGYMQEPSPENTDKLALFSKWKVLTGVLLQPSQSQNVDESKLYDNNGATILDTMDAVLGPFIQTNTDGSKRRRNMEMILTRAARLAFLLFSQPGLFRFDFMSSQGDEFIVFPALLQVVGDQSQVLSPSKVLWGKEFSSDFPELAK